MKKLKRKYTILKYSIFSIFFIFFSYWPVIANDNNFIIQGNNFTDTDAILSLLNEMPENINEEYSNTIIKALNDSNLFEDVSVKYENNIFIINVSEYANINKIFFDNNERLKDEELNLIIEDLDIKNLNTEKINFFIDELEKIYQSFGYNNINIEYSEKIYIESNTADIYFNIKEGKITKINKIIIEGNQFIPAENIKNVIKSKTKSIKNIFANNNFKPSAVERDTFLISNFYKDNGYIDVEVEYRIEYLETNKVNIYFNISEGNIYSFSSIDLIDENNLLNNNLLDLINLEINQFLNNENTFSYQLLNKLKKNISSIIVENENKFFEIISLEKKEKNLVNIIFQLNPISPKYTNQINIVGNSRTLDYVIRRELEIVEGDAIYESQIENIRDKLNSLNLFESVKVNEEIIDQDNVNLIIEVVEKQTGSFNAGVSVGTLDGFSIVTGLRERNFYGTGRSLEVLLNTSEDKNQFKLITTDRLFYENDAKISYSVNYKQQDFSTASSYKLDTFLTGIGIGYKLNRNLHHNIDLEYLLKDYKITNSSTVSDSILNSSGGNMSFLIINNLRYSSLNKGLISKNGNFVNFNNSIETPTSSNNGFVKNVLTLKKYYNNNNNIYSIQTKIGNIFSLNNNDILTDDKFSLGGRWLRGFDSYGAGPRNSRTSYVGGNNIVVTKFDYSYEITRSSNFPIYLNFFNDYGLIWENKTKPTQSDNNLRSSAGFGIKYYSPIGPIGFTWGFPIMDEQYDIKRMFLFSIGNID